MPQFLNPPDQQINQSYGNHRKPDVCPAEKVCTGNRKTIFRIVAQLRFKQRPPSYDPPADKEKYPPRHKGIMPPFAMSEKLRKVIMQQTYSNRKINKKYGPKNIFQKIPDRKCTCRIKYKNKHDRHCQQQREPDERYFHTCLHALITYPAGNIPLIGGVCKHV